MGAAGNGTSLSGTLTLTVTPTDESDVVFDVYTSCAGGGQRGGRCGPDRGCQCTSEVYTNVLERHGVRSSLSRPGNCWDNAVAESIDGGTVDMLDALGYEW
jgi:hypothetical protein